MKTFYLILIALFQYSILIAQTNVCAPSVSMSSSPAPINNSYPANTTVTFTFTVNGYVQIASNWFHSVRLNLNNGWLNNSLVPVSMPASCSNNGYWAYYSSVTSTGSGITYGPGFYFDYNTAFTPADNNPGNNFGDQNLNNMCTWTFVWSLQTGSTGASLSGNSICVTGDGTTGGWASGGNICSCNAYSFNGLINNSSCGVGLTMSGVAYAGWPIQFSATYAPNKIYNWQLSDGYSTSALSFSHIFFAPGTYDVCLYVQDTISGCADTICIPVDVVSPSSIYPGYYSLFLTGQLFYDSNQDGVMQADEFYLYNTALHSNCSNYNTYTQPDGSFMYSISAGTCNLSLPDIPDYIITTGQNLNNITMDTAIVSLGLIGLYSNSTEFNPSISTYLSSAVCNQAALFRHVLYNGSSQSIQAQITVTLDSVLLAHSGFSISEYETWQTWGGTAINPINTNGNTLTFDAISIAPYSYRYLHQLVNYPIQAFDTYYIKDSVIINSSTNNVTITDIAEGVYTCAFDPNDKMVQPYDGTETNITQAGEKLVYRIRFQNTGNDTAYHVLISDTLDNTLNHHTIRLLESSHYVVFYKNGPELHFSFPNIMLPDSFSNALGSQGYILFEVAQMPLLAEGTIIKNKAAIYFDGNDPIITNTAISTLPVSVGALPIDQEIMFYPNPSSKVVYFKNIETQTTVYVYDITGRLLINTIIHDSRSLDISSLDSGVYLVKVGKQQDKVNRVMKLIVK
jgi:uncharacterized repeat protein (TIGR01451 family)